jgi:hypothetical protein
MSIVSVHGIIISAIICDERSVSGVIYQRVDLCTNNLLGGDSSDLAQYQFHWCFDVKILAYS